MLPAFPKIEAARAQANRQLIELMVAKLAPAIGLIARQVQFEGCEARIHRHDRTVGHTPMKRVSSEVILPRMTLIEFTQEELVRRLRDIAEQQARGISQVFYGEMDRVTAETGNVIDAKGQPITDDLILKMFEKMEHTFKPDGSWNPPTLLAGQEITQRLMEHAASPERGEFNERLGKILEKKRDDFNRREADRVLAG